MSTSKEIVSLDRFIYLMNETLRKKPSYQEGMKFTKVETGYDFDARMLTILENQALDKKVFDCVSRRYGIAS